MDPGTSSSSAAAPTADISAGELEASSVTELCIVKYYFRGAPSGLSNFRGLLASRRLHLKALPKALLVRLSLDIRI